MSAIHIGRVIAGKYRLEEPRARGGMGSVWVARHLQLDTPLAIKFIEPEVARSTDGRARFEREAKAAAHLQSPNVVHVHDYGVEDDTPYIVMELLNGEDLSTRLAREGRLPLPQAVHIVSQIAKVLRRAHDANIVHRDLKPGNIFLVRSDDGDEHELVKVLDFGVAKAPRLGSVGETTRTGTLIGSPRYMSPEQARGTKTVDHRSDLWSLAVIAFRMVTGELPFPGEELGDVILKICTEPIPRASDVVPALGPDMDAFFDRALQRDPERRFQSAREMSIAFAVAAGEPPPSMTFSRAMAANLAGMVRTASDPSLDPVAAPPPAPSSPPAPPTPSTPSTSEAAPTVVGGRAPVQAASVEITRVSGLGPPPPPAPPAPPASQAESTVFQGKVRGPKAKTKAETLPVTLAASTPLPAVEPPVSAPATPRLPLPPPQVIAVVPSSARTQPSPMFSAPPSSGAPPPPSPVPLSPRFSWAGTLGGSSGSLEVHAPIEPSPRMKARWFAAGAASLLAILGGFTLLWVTSVGAPTSSPAAALAPPDDRASSPVPPRVEIVAQAPSSLVAPAVATAIATATPSATVTPATITSAGATVAPTSKPAAGRKTPGEVIGRARR